MIDLREEIFCYVISFVLVIFALFTDFTIYTYVFGVGAVLFHPIVVNTVMLYISAYKYKQYLIDYRHNLLDHNSPARAELTEFMIDYLKRNDSSR